jgi:copper chaperone
MMNIKRLLLFFVIMSYLCGARGSEKIAAQSKTTSTSTFGTNKVDTLELQLEIEGMSCQRGCADGIDAKLKKMDGVIRSKTVFETGKSSIQFDKRKVSKQAILDAIRSLGYTPKEISSNPKK